MSSVITVLAYKSSGEESCRGCVVESWDSDFELHTTKDIADAGVWLGRKKFSHSKEKNKSECEFTILIDGVGGEDARSLSWESVEDFEKREALVAEIEASSNKLFEHLVETEKKRKTDEESARHKRIQEELRQGELERLKQKLSPESLEADRQRLLELQKSV